MTAPTLETLQNQCHDIYKGKASKQAAKTLLAIMDALEVVAKQDTSFTDFYVNLAISSPSVDNSYNRTYQGMPRFRYVVSCFAEGRYTSISQMDAHSILDDSPHGLALHSAKEIKESYQLCQALCQKITRLLATEKQTKHMQDLAQQFETLANKADRLEKRIQRHKIGKPVRMPKQTEPKIYPYDAAVLSVFKAAKTNKR